MNLSDVQKVRRLPFRCQGYRFMPMPANQQISLGCQSKVILSDSKLPTPAEVAVIEAGVAEFGEISISELLEASKQHSELGLCQPEIVYGLYYQLGERRLSSQNFVVMMKPSHDHFLLLGPDSTGKPWINACYADLPGKFPSTYRIIFQLI